MTCSEIASVGGTSAAPAEPDWRCSTSSSTRNGSPSACASSASRVAESVAPRAAASLRTSAWDRRSSSTVVTPGRRASPAAGTDNGPSSRTVATTRTGRVTAATATWASTAHESASAHCRSSRTSRQGRRWPTSPRNRATASPSTSPGSTPVSGGAPPAASVQSGSSRPSAAPYGPRAAGVISCPARRAATSASAIGRKAPPPSIARPVARRGRRRLRGQLLQEPGLADAGLAADDHHATAAGRSGGEGGPERVELLIATDEGCTSHGATLHSAPSAWRECSRFNYCWRGQTAKSSPPRRNRCPP